MSKPFLLRRPVESALAWTIAVAPILAFPEFLWPHGTGAVVTVAVLSMVAAAALLAPCRPLIWGVTGLAVTATIGWALVPHRENALAHFSGLALGLLCMAVVSAACSTRRRLAQAGGVFVLLGLVALTLGLGSTSIPSPTKYLPGLAQRLPQVPIGLPGLEAGGFVNPNALGGTALMILPIAWVFARLNRSGAPQRGLRLVSALTAGIAGLVMVITQSRSVWVAAWALMVAAAVHHSRRRVRFLLLLALFVVPAVAVAVIRPRMDPTVVSASARVEARRLIWSEGLRRIQEKPLVGIGLNEFRHVFRGIPPGPPADVPHAHNMVIQTALDIGLPGLGAYVFVIATLFRRALAAAHTTAGTAGRVAGAAALSLLGVHVFGLADAVALGAKVGLFQWFAAGILLAAAKVAAVESHGVGDLPLDASARPGHLVSSFSRFSTRFPNLPKELNDAV